MGQATLTPAQQAKLQTQLDRWRDELVNLTRRNKLLAFKHTKSSSFEIAPSQVPELAKSLGEERRWGFYLPPEDDTVRAPARNELVLVSKKTPDIRKGLTSLERTSSGAFNDTGLWTLYIGFGVLKWTDPADDRGYESPLILQPVSFDRVNLQAPFTVGATDEEAVLNPALEIKLSEFDLQLPSIDVYLDSGLGTFLKRAQSAVASRPGWTVEMRAVLTTFTFHKDVMYRDLLKNAEQMMDHDLVQLLAIGASAPCVQTFAFEPPSEDQLDITSPPEDLVSIRDADATQRACIVAASNGRSFVMDGPPGTGKSQTIANMIAELLHIGKSVLFVSEKVAALEVVFKRLDEAGLSEFLLPLHSHKATRKEVAKELGRALSHQPSATNRFQAHSRSELAALRQELNGYAVAMNLVRTPLKQSLHNVLGRIACLQHHPHGPVAGSHGHELSADQHVTLLDAAARLQRAWGPVERGDLFLWRELIDTDSSASKTQYREQLLGDLDRSTERLRQRLYDFNLESGMDFSPSLGGATELTALLRLAASNPAPKPPPAHWLMPGELDAIERLAKTRRAQRERWDHLQRKAVGLAGAHWHTLPTDHASEVERLLGQLAAMRPSITFTNGVTSQAAADVADTIRRAGEAGAAIVRDSEYIAGAFGMPVDALPPSSAIELAELGSLTGSAVRPEPTWLTPLIQAALTEAEAVLSQLVQEYRDQKAQLLTRYNEGLLDPSFDVQGLHSRMTTTSGLKKLGGQHRQDKKALAHMSLSGRADDENVQRLQDVVQLHAHRRRLEAAEHTHAPVLGSYYPGPDNVDWERVHRALDMTRRALTLTRGASSTEAMYRQLANGGEADPEVLLAASRLRANVEAWEQSVLPEVRDKLGIDLTDLSIVQTWALEAGGAAQALGDRLDVCDKHLQRITTTGTIADLSVLKTEFDGLVSTLSSEAPSDAERLGALYQGPKTDYELLDAQIVWAWQLCEASSTELHEAAVASLLSPPLTADELAEELGRSEKLLTSLLDEFSTPYRDRLAEEFNADLTDVRTLLGELRSTLGDVDEWSRFAAARAELIDADLHPIVEFAIASGLARHQVAEVIERSILERWVDEVIRSDRRLKVTAATERDELVRKFAELDRQQVHAASALVINACSGRRPRTILGASALIQREAEKKSRHMPTRDLLATTGEIALRLKPCFMMSPLTVSQFLPPDLEFDVVIFDEASQVRPSDAANCVYRGKQLIVAGDPKQLPPTSFFDRASDGSDDDYDEDGPEDFESILDVCRGSGLPNLPLRWHYRSQHESLITFSNYRFYRGSLHTFPGARGEGEDVGVELIHANGVYRRGGGSDNPIEAQKVVERVLFHRRNHPTLSLGVIAFSTAQQEAILAAVEQQSAEHPELNELLTSERLDGFFVKNLETVQGDERDIIIFSIGYGRDENGKFTEQLGPLLRAGGERRLNVAITRARHRVEVISSVRAADFPGTSQAQGVRQLQAYLDFAERGPVALALDIGDGEHVAESPFEEEVLRVINNLAYTAVPQVGVAGYRIDIGIRHPDRPGEYVLGIECDGAAYHSSKVARDRDRLRQEVLESLGWTIFRIWGPSWYRDRANGELQLQRAIESAISGGPRPPTEKPAAPSTEVTITEIELDGPPAWVQQYRVTALSTWISSGTFTEQHARSDLADLIHAVVRTEGPIHEDAIRDRVRDACRIPRMGSRLQEAYNLALRLAMRTNKLERDREGFISVGGSTLPEVRCPSPDIRSNRAVGRVAHTEQDRAIVLLLREVGPLDMDALTLGFRRAFGWNRSGPDIQGAVLASVRRLERAGSVMRTGASVRLASE